MKTFNIDFGAFCMLCVATIPSQKQIHTVFWSQLINEYYHQLSDDQRILIWSFVLNNPSFSLKNHHCAVFDARFNPENQYLITTEHDGEPEYIQAFLFNSLYHTGSQMFIQPHIIVKVEPIEYNEPDVAPQG